jgi:WD40 repeat protein
MASASPVVERDLPGHTAAAKGVRFSRDGRQVLSWGDDGTARLDGREGVTVFAAEKALGREAPPKARDAELSPDGRWLAVGYDDGAARVWKVSSAHWPPVVLRLGGDVWRTAYSPDASRLLTVSDAAPAKIWPAEGRGKARLLPHLPAADGLSDGAWSPDGRRLALASFGGRLWVRKASGGEPLALVRAGGVAHTGAIKEVSFSPSGDLVLSAGGGDGDVCVWRTDGTGRPVVLANGGAALDAAFSPDGKRVASASEIGAVRVSRILWRDLARHLRNATSANLTPEERQLYLGESARTAHEAFAERERRFGRTP